MNPVVFAPRHPVTVIVGIAAVGTQGERTFCFRVEGGKAVRTPIQVGLRGADLVEVVKKQTGPAGSAEDGRWEDFTGEEVIAVGDLASLTDGREVSVATGKK
jgi:hypothetical protein